MAQPHVLEHGRAAVAPGFRTRFSVKGLRWLEPRFLGLEEAPDDEAHGVVFEIDEEAWQEMARHEVSYVATPIRAVVDGTSVDAVALVLRPERRHADGVPSSRYAAQLHQGAAHHGLPAALVDHYAELERTGNRITRYLSVLSPVVRTLVPWLGLKGAVAVVVSGIVGPPVLLMAWWLLQAP